MVKRTEVSKRAPKETLYSEVVEVEYSDLKHATDNFLSGMKLGIPVVRLKEILSEKSTFQSPGGKLRLEVHLTRELDDEEE